MTQKVMLKKKYSKIIATYLSAKFNNLNNVSVSSINALSTTTFRSNVDKFDVLIIDEGQDLCNWDDLATIEKYLNGGWQDGYWYFFHDINNQAGIIGKYSPEAMDYLKSFSPVLVPLRKNCRNTKPIISKIQELTHFDMGTSGNGIGPEVDIINSSEIEQADILCQELEKLRSENISFKDITILSAKDFSDSCVQKMGRNSRKRIQVVNDFNVISPDNNKIQFAKISTFKGLENQCVILVDINCRIDNYYPLLYMWE